MADGYTRSNHKRPSCAIAPRACSHKDCEDVGESECTSCAVQSRVYTAEDHGYAQTAGAGYRYSRSP